MSSTIHDSSAEVPLLALSERLITPSRPPGLRSLSQIRTHDVSLVRPLKLADNDEEFYDVVCITSVECNLDRFISFKG